jgi:hypothetical protein
MKTPAMDMSRMVIVVLLLCLLWRFAVDLFVILLLLHSHSVLLLSCKGLAWTLRLVDLTRESNSHDDSLTLPFFSPVLLQKSADCRFYKYGTIVVLAEFACCWLLLVSKMPHPEKNKVGGHLNDVVEAVDDDFLASFGALSVDELANVLEFLPPKDIMRQRRVCRKCSEAATKTIVPLTDFCINSLEKYDRMVVMTRAMPNLQQITLCAIGPFLVMDSLKKYNAMRAMARVLPNLQQISIGVHEGSHKWSDGEDPDEEEAAEYAHDHWITHDIEILSNFRKLRVLNINSAGLNGRYPFLFNSFPLLQKLYIQWCNYLKCDLEMFAGLPMLEELNCHRNNGLTGNLKSLRVLKDTLERVSIEYCGHVEGNFMDMADFPLLKALNLLDTAVTGDIRDIGDNDFSALERLRLPKGVYGGIGYEFHRISDAPDLIRAIYLFNRQRPALKIQFWFGKLSEDSPDWYDPVDDHRISYTPPFKISFVEARYRVGYRWGTANGHHPCEVNWLDPEPDKESSDYAKYMERMRWINSHVKFYKGFHQPPTAEEYRRLYRRRAGRSVRLAVG